jgi:hypothetical protein
MTGPCSSSCGGGAGGGPSADVLSTTLFPVGLDDWLARWSAPVDGTGGTCAAALLLWVKEILFW